MVAATDKETVSIIIRISPELRQKFKVMCAKKNVSMKSLFERFIEKEVKKDEQG